MFWSHRQSWYENIFNLIENAHVSLDTEDDLREIRTLMTNDELRRKYQEIQASPR